MITPNCGSAIYICYYYPPSNVVSPQNDMPPAVILAHRLPIPRSLGLGTRDPEVSSPHTEDKSINAI